MGQRPQHTKSILTAVVCVHMNVRMCVHVRACVCMCVCVRMCTRMHAWVPHHGHVQIALVCYGLSSIRVVNHVLTSMYSMLDIRIIYHYVIWYNQWLRHGHEGSMTYKIPGPKVSIFYVIWNALINRFGNPAYSNNTIIMFI